MGLQAQIFRAGTSREIDTAFAAIVREQSDALYVGNETFFNSRRVQLVHRATLHKIPAISQRQYTEIGGLMSYGTNVTDAFRQVGIYAGRILKGAKPADLPVVQATKFELFINAQTARMLDLTVPPAMLATADEVIEWVARRRGHSRRGRSNGTECLGSACFCRVRPCLSRPGLRHSWRAFGTSGMSREEPSSSSGSGDRIGSIDCPIWRPNS
jgi:hypothetical protein